MMDEGKRGALKSPGPVRGGVVGRNVPADRRGEDRKGVFRETKLNFQLPCFLMVRPLWCCVTFYPNLW